MRRWFWAWKAESSLYQEPSDITKEFGFAESVSGEGDRFCFRENGRVFSYRYEWEVSPGDGVYRVTENAYLSWLWWVFSGGSFWVALIGIILFVNLTGFLQLLVVFLELAAVSGMCVGFLAMLRKKSPVFDLIEGGSSHELYIPAASYLVPGLLLLLLVMLFPGLPQLIALVGLSALFAVYTFKHEDVVEQSFRWQNWFTDRAKNLPMVAGRYVAIMLLSMSAIYIFISAHDGPLFVFFMQRAPLWTSVAFSVIFLLYLEIIRDSLLYDNQLAEITRYKEEGRNIRSRYSILITGLSVVAVSFGFAYLSYLFAIEAADFVMRYPIFPAILLVLITGLPILYVFTGLVYQLYTAVFGILNLYKRLQNRDFSEIYRTDACVYTLDAEEMFAGAATLGTRDAIIVSKRMEEILEPDELAAILAHEESHIENRENRLATFIAVGSPFLLTAKNVLYAIFDFQEREFRADREAALKTSPEDLEGALNKIQAYKAQQKTEDIERFETIMPTLTSFIDQDKSPGFGQRYFGFFFGGFAVSEVHPSLSDRIRELK